MKRLTARSATVARLPVILGLLVLWEIAAALWGDPMFVARPSQVIAILPGLLGDGGVVAAIGTAFVEIIIAFVLAATIGAVAGVLLGSTRLMRRSILQIVFVCYAIPQSIFMPLFVLVVGIGPAAKITYGFIHGVFVVTLAVSAGVQNVDQQLVRAARSMGASRWQILTTIIIPHMLPSFFTGLRLCMTGVILGVMLAELYVSLNGIGYFTQRATQLFDPPRLFGLIAVLAIMAMFLNGVCRMIEVHYSRWRVRTPA